MVSLTETTTIPLPADEVWPLLSDPALVASCIPGAELAPDKGDGLWRGSIRVKFGPTVAVFRGEASLAFDPAARTCTIEGRGIDGRGASRALASGVVRVSGADVTELAVDGSFTVSGPLETFANALSPNPAPRPVKGSKSPIAAHTNGESQRGTSKSANLEAKFVLPKRIDGESPDQKDD